MCISASLYVFLLIFWFENFKWFVFLNTWHHTNGSRLEPSLKWKKFLGELVFIHFIVSWKIKLIIYPYCSGDVVINQIEIFRRSHGCQNSLDPNKSCFPVLHDDAVNETTRQTSLFGGERVKVMSASWPTWPSSEYVVGQRQMKSGGVLRSGPGCQGEQSFPVDLSLNSGPWPMPASGQMGAGWGAGLGLGFF